MKIAIIGCGLIGEKRSKALAGHDLVALSDMDLARAERLAQLHSSVKLVSSDWKKVAASPEVDLVIVSTTNDALTPVGLHALEHGKIVLVEKPAARSYLELKPFWQLAEKLKRYVKIGFNLRYHPALLKAKELVDSGQIGDLMFIRGRYGHGGRLGYEKEWRADPRISGGGELIDQGVT